MDTLTVLANVSQIAGLLIAVAAAVIAIKALDIAKSQLKDAVNNTGLSKKAAEATEKSARGQFILAIDAAFCPYDHVRAAINDPRLPDPSLADRQRYIAVCERLGYLIEWDLIDLQTVDDLYGDRIKKLIEYYRRKDWDFPPRTRSKNWWGFVVLWQHLQKVRPLPDPPEIPAARGLEPDESGTAP